MCKSSRSEIAKWGHRTVGTIVWPVKRVISSEGLEYVGGGDRIGSGGGRRAASIGALIRQACLHERGKGQLEHPRKINPAAGSLLLHTPIADCVTHGQRNGGIAASPLIEERSGDVIVRHGDGAVERGCRPA